METEVLQNKHLHKFTIRTIVFYINRITILKMTFEQNEIIEGLRRVKLPYGATFDKSFIEKMYFSKRNYDLSEKQNTWIYKLLYKYRAQLPELFEKHKENEFCKP